MKGIKMSRNLKVYTEMSRTQFAKEIGRTLVVGTAQSTAVYLGLIASGYIIVAVNKALKNARKKEN
jgi:hypothetical protein